MKEAIGLRAEKNVIAAEMIKWLGTKVDMNYYMWGSTAKNNKY